jgi:hypothetical protein
MLSYEVRFCEAFRSGVSVDDLQAVIRCAWANPDSDCLGGKVRIVRQENDIIGE